MLVSIVRAELEDARVLVEIKNCALDGLVRRYYGQKFAGVSGVDDVNEELRLIRECEVYKIMFRGRIIGEVLVRRGDDGIVELEDLVIVAEYQGLGYGMQVLGMLEEKYPEVVEWRLSALVISVGSQKFYEKAGYVEVKRDDVEVWYVKGTPIIQLPASSKP